MRAERKHGQLKENKHRTKVTPKLVKVKDDNHQVEINKEVEVHEDMMNNTKYFKSLLRLLSWVKHSLTISLRHAHLAATLRVTLLYGRSIFRL